MKKIILYLTLALAGFAQSPINVQQGGAGRNGYEITRDLYIGPGRVIRIEAGGSLIVDAGATLTLGNGVIAGSALSGLYTDAGLTISAQNRILGRVSSGAGAVEELTASGVLDILGSTRGSVLYRGASGWRVLIPGTVNYVLTSGGAGADPTWSAGGSGGGSVTNVALALPNIFVVSGSPVTSTGTLTGTLAVQNANKVWAGPTTGADAAPTFRTLVAADIPSLAAVYQPLNANLTALSGLTGAANKLPYFTGSGALALADFTPAGFSLTLAGNATVSGTNTGDQTTITGNAGTATALQTPRNINGVAFDGTANITVTAAAGTLTGGTLAANVLASSLTSVGTIATGVWQGTPIASTYGGSGSAFFAVSGPASTIKTYTLPNVTTTILTTNAAVTVAQGGIGITSGTSGGVPFFDTTGSMASSGTLTQNTLILGGGTGAAPTSLTAGTATTLLHGNASGAPTFSAVSLTADVTGRLPYANIAQGSALSVLGVTGNATADVASIAAASDNQVLRRSGTTLSFGAVNLASTAAVTGNLQIVNFNGGTSASSSTYWRGDGTWGSITATASRISATITQTSHGFVAGDVLYNANGTFTKAKADAFGTCGVVGIVESVTDANNFVIVYGGPITLSGLTVSTIYYLSDATAGLLTTTAPTTTSSFVVPILYTGTATQAYVQVSAPSALAKISLTTDVTGTLPVANGGTGATTLTGILQGNGTSAVTAVTDSTTTGQVLRVTGSATYAWGALDLANSSAVTGILASGNGGTGNAFFALSGPATSIKTYTLPNVTTTILTTNAAVTVAQGGIGITSGTSGGVPYFSGTSTIASSLALAANQIVLGGGSGTAPATLGSLGTTTTVLHGNASGAPTFGAVTLTTDVTGTLPVANGGTGITSLGSGVAAALGIAPNATGGMVTAGGTPRITTITSSFGTPTVNTDACDCVTMTGVSAAITSMTTNLSGTPVNFQQLEYRIKDDGTARAITWGASFVSGNATLPTTTTISKALHVWFEYDTVQSKWVCVGTGSDA